MGGMGRRERRGKQLLDDLKEKISYWNLKEEARVRPVWRTRFGRNYRTVVRERMNLMFIGPCIIVIVEE